MPGRVLAVGLDGLDIGYANALLAAGELPHLAAMRDRSARFLLESDGAQRTGLSWEHFASGLAPADAHRSSAIEFDELQYDVVQAGARFAPFFAGLDCRTLVFDAPYTRLAGIDRARGVVAWGAHDPGLPLSSQPPELAGELTARFGGYPAKRWTYAVPWHSPDETAAMGAGLVEAVERRTDLTRALLQESDWDLAILVASELHSGSEALWHGHDPEHALHGHPSAAAANEGLRAVTRAMDALVQTAVDTADADAVVVFSLGGMGINGSDLPAMALLPELMYRWATGSQLLDPPAAWSARPEVAPVIAPSDDWDAAVARCYPGPPASVLRRAARRLPARVRKALRHSGRRRALTGEDISVDWMPATRYRKYWPAMRAFAIPSFYDGRIRVNLRGREVGGLVDAADYHAVCDEIEELVRACRDPHTGESVVAGVERAPDPMRISGSDGDLIVIWRDSAWAFRHPRHGLIGPLPYRRTGGHSGRYGFAYVDAPGIAPGDQEVRSPFDVTPTLVDLLGFAPLDGITGTSLLRASVEPTALVDG